MNWTKLFFYIIIITSVVHLAWYFYDRYEKHAFCNAMLQTAITEQNKDMVNYLFQTEETNDLCNSKFNGFKLMIDVVVIAYGVYWLSENRKKEDKT